MSQIWIPLSHSPTLSTIHQLQLRRLFQSTSCCYTNFTALFKNICKMSWKTLWRQSAQGWSDELCWEQTLSLKSYSDTRTQLVAGGTIQLSINWRTELQRQWMPLPSLPCVSLTVCLTFFKHHHPISPLFRVIHINLKADLSTNWATSDEDACACVFLIGHVMLDFGWLVQSRINDVPSLKNTCRNWICILQCSFHSLVLHKYAYNLDFVFFF